MRKAEREELERLREAVDHKEKLLRDAQAKIKEQENVILRLEGKNQALLEIIERALPTKPVQLGIKV